MIYIASFGPYESKKFVQCWNKVEKKIQEQQPNQFHFYNKNMGLVNRMDQNLAKYWYPNEKTVVVPISFNGRCCYSGWASINKDKGDESLPLLIFRRQIVNVIFMKYSKEGRLFSSHLEIRNIPSNICYDDKKHYQVQSEDGRIQKLFKQLRGSGFA